MKKPSTSIQLDSAFYRFMLDYHIPAISVAVSKDGKMIYQKAFGIANLSDGTEATTESLFRIGGLSTAITSLAIRKLIADRKLSYDSKVFGKGSILGNVYEHHPNQHFLEAITIADLIKHTSGGWAGAEDFIGTPNLRSRLNSPDSILPWIVEHVTIKDNPGSAMNFSFTGYWILGRVIEKITGMSYEKWVSENLLKPSNITGMQIEKAGRHPSPEVTFYMDKAWPFKNGEIDQNSYLWRADAVLGWIASSGDLVKLMLRFNNNSSLSDLKKTSRFHTTNRLVENNNGFAPDWAAADSSNNWQEQFNMYGSSSILVRFSKGYCWAVLINTYRPVIDSYFPDIDSVMTRAMENRNIRMENK